MNWAWTTSLDQLWRSSNLPIWMPLAAAGFFGFILLIVLVRAQKSVANVALVVITLASIGGAVGVTMRGLAADGRGSGETRFPQQTAALPALSCIDDLAGETVLAACEKALFGSADAAAAAVSYAAAKMSRLTAFGDVAVANRKLSYELLTLRRAVERDRYGVMAQVLVTRDQCTPSQCAAFRALTDSRQIMANMTERTYDGLITRYAPAWNAPAASGPVAGLGSSIPTGKPTNADFPTAASTPPVNIMTPEPGSAPAPSSPSRTSAASANAPAPATNTPAAANAALLSPRPTSSAAPTALATAKKPAPKPRSSAPVQLAPAAAPASATANE